MNNNLRNIILFVLAFSVLLTTCRDKLVGTIKLKGVALFAKDSSIVSNGNLLIYNTTGGYIGSLKKFSYNFIRKVPNCIHADGSFNIEVAIDSVICPRLYIMADTGVLSSKDTNSFTNPNNSLVPIKTEFNDTLFVH